MNQTEYLNELNNLNRELNSLTEHKLNLQDELLKIENYQLQISKRLYDLNTHMLSQTDMNMDINSYRNNRRYELVYDIQYNQTRIYDKDNNYRLVETFEGRV